MNKHRKVREKKETYLHSIKKHISVFQKWKIIQNQDMCQAC